MKTANTIQDLILLEDQNYVIVNKPAGMLVIPERNPTGNLSMKELLVEHFGEIFVVHRLDRDTSGIVCFAKNAEAHSHLSVAFENRQVHKTYDAIVQGCPHPPDGTIDQPIGEDKRLAGKMCIDKKGKPSLTHFVTHEAYKSFAWLKVSPVTGRTHQIRVHMTSIGHPLAVDPLYGSRESLTIMEIKRRAKLGKYVEEANPIISRLTLHAHNIEFTAIDGTQISVEAPMPKDLDILVRQLEKWNK